MVRIFNHAVSHLIAKIWQYIISIAGGLLVAFESSIPFFIPCLILTVIDIYAALCLARRVHQKHPDRSDGKFKSEYKFKIMKTMLIALVAIIVAQYADMYVIKDSDLAVRSVVGFFLFYQLWSISENWSSENDNKIAKAFQRIMVNKAERHYNVTLSDILLNEEKKEDNGES
ncbi:phage holin family protein [Dysgonomonas sp. ZJ279]|uniref:phage holin family protein n=1 Tax=Dysgonomonas sp. ZJ279 TaxID=2709796 RepID=UPI0013EC5078|nr:phage holin family protein [Dysgonomonas sp. ZJ279]